MSQKKLTASQQAQVQASIQVLETFVPQLFSSPKTISENAPDVGEIDEWMMSNFPPEVLIPLTGLKMIAEADDRPDIHAFISYILRGFKGINGFSAKQGENIAIGIMGGGGNRKIVKKPNILSRTITNRNWRQKAEDEGSEIAE